MILKAKPGVDFEDLSDNGLIRLCVGAVAEHESLKDPDELAELTVDLRSQGGPTFRGDGLEIELYGNEYMLMDTDLAEVLAKDQIEEFANDQWRDLAVTLDQCGINSTYIKFDDDMFIQDCMMDWSCWVGSYDDVVDEYFPMTDFGGKLENFGCFSIWRTS